MADALRVDVGKGSEKLVDVQLDLQRGHGGLHFIEKTRCPIDGLRNEFLDQIEIDLILLIFVSATTLSDSTKVIHTRSPFE